MRGLAVPRKSAAADLELQSAAALCTEAAGLEPSSFRRQPGRWVRGGSAAVPVLEPHLGLSRLRVYSWSFAAGEDERLVPRTPTDVSATAAEARRLWRRVQFDAVRSGAEQAWTPVRSRSGQASWRTRSTRAARRGCGCVA